ncbi:unnamed protein product [Anisakis simplex]|uniref:Uncharacterized protein n=1 Tax=Anisakis simplex TaxID=6269 RepID=A0A3P6SG84_ANISI|nr:unnamed protein product [Anisakis simplex]
MNRDERAHAMLLILNELLRIGNVNAEKRRIKSLNQEAILSNQRNVIDTNAIDWLCEDIYSNTVHSRTAKLLIAEKFEKIYEVCTRCMSTNRTVSCQIILLEILPRLLSFQNILEADNDNYEGCAVEPSSVFTYVLSLTNKHPQSLATLGLFILDKPQQLRARIPQLLGVIQQMLQSAINKRKASDENVFTCLTLVVRALDVNIENDIRNLLPLLFATGLSKGLIDVTYEIMVCIPSLKTDVQDGLLKELCQLLMNRKLPNKLDPPSSPPIPSGPVQVTNVAVTKLALAALAKFDFQRHALQMFIKYIAHVSISLLLLLVLLLHYDICCSYLKLEVN